MAEEAGERERRWSRRDAPAPAGAEAEGSAGLPVAQGQSWESMSAWAGCWLSEALGDGKSSFGRTRSRLLFIHGRVRASAKPPPLAACARLGSASAPGAADSLPGWPGRTEGSHVPPSSPLPGVPGAAGRTIWVTTALC